MTKWRRAREREECGRCGEPLALDAPVQVLMLREVTSVKLRCPKCATEAVPASLPDTVRVESFLRARREAGMTVVASLAKTLRRDYKALAVGEREPGQEG